MILILYRFLWQENRQRKHPKKQVELSTDRFPRRKNDWEIKTKNQASKKKSIWQWVWEKIPRLWGGRRSHKRARFCRHRCLCCWNRRSKDKILRYWSDVWEKDEKREGRRSWRTRPGCLRSGYNELDWPKRQWSHSLGRHRCRCHKKREIWYLWLGWRPQKAETTHTRKVKPLTRTTENPYPTTTRITSTKLVAEIVSRQGFWFLIPERRSFPVGNSVRVTCFNPRVAKNVTDEIAIGVVVAAIHSTTDEGTIWKITKRKSWASSSATTTTSSTVSDSIAVISLIEIAQYLQLEKSFGSWSSLLVLYRWWE